MKTFLTLFFLIVSSIFVVVSCDSAIKEKQELPVNKDVVEDSVIEQSLGVKQNSVTQLPVRDANREEYDRLVDLERRLVWVFKEQAKARYMSNDGLDSNNKFDLRSNQIYALMMEVFSIKESLYYPFDSLKGRGVAIYQTVDKKIRGYCWFINSDKEFMAFQSYLQFMSDDNIKIQKINTPYSFYNQSRIIGLHKIDSSIYLVITEDRLLDKSQSVFCYRFYNNYLSIVPNIFPNQSELTFKMVNTNTQNLNAYCNTSVLSAKLDYVSQRVYNTEMSYNDSLKILSHVDFNKIKRIKYNKNGIIKTPLKDKIQYKFENGKFRLINRN